MFDFTIAEALLVALFVAVPVLLIGVAVKVVQRSHATIDRPGTASPATGTAPRGSWLSQSLARWALRWVSLGGAVTVVGLGNLVAALNWNAITKGFSGDPGSAAATGAAAASGRVEANV